MKKIAVLGATGSIGRQTLEVIRENRQSFDVRLISAFSDSENAARIAHEFHPSYIVMGSEEAAEKVRSSLDYPACVLASFSDVCSLIGESGCEYAIIATSGMQGIEVFEYCLLNGITVGLANKESIVCGGHIIKDIWAKSTSKVYPVDSEHSAIYQCLKNSFDSSGVGRILLTASGGPFFGRDAAFLENVTVEDALNHPNWSMGQKITVDSATLANKGQEVIEACFLFDVRPDQVEVIVHPQSIVHSMVEYADGSIMAQMGPVDMRLPIQRCIYENDIIQTGLFSAPDLTDIQTLSFHRPDADTFRCLKLAYSALEAGGCATAVYSIADEIAVEKFLERKMRFSEIPVFIEKLLGKYSDVKCSAVSDIIELDAKIRRECI